MALITTQSPRYGNTGLITGYDTIDPLTGSAPNSRYTTASDRPMYGPNGTIIDSASGQPYTGTYNGAHVKNGVQLQLNPSTGQYDTADNIAQSNAAKVNDPASRYQSVNIDKNPDIESATSDLVKQFKTTADGALKDFSDYLGNFQSDVSSARNAGKVATDPTQTIASLTTANQNFQGNLNDANNRYQTALQTGQDTENNIVSQAQNNLGQFDTAAQNVADHEQQALQAQLSRYKLSSGTPTSMGSDEQKILAQGVQNIQLPTQLAKIQQSYNVLGQYALPVARDVTGQNVQYAGSFLPNIAGSSFGANTSTANNIQNVKMQVANMSFDDATKYMQSLGIPWAVQSQILQGNVSALGGLNNLESGSRYQGLQDTLGVNVTQPQGYSFAGGMPPTYNTSYPNVGRYSGGNGQTSTASTGAVPAASPNPGTVDPYGLISGLGLPGFGNFGTQNNQSADYYDNPNPVGNPGSYFA